MNKTIHIGNLTKDPETKVSQQTGKKRTIFTIACNRKFASQDGTRKADFITYSCFDTLAENVAKYLTKGRKVSVIGHVQTGSYESDGRTVYTTHFIADEVEFLSSKQDSQEQAPTQETGSENKRYNPNGELPPQPSAPQGGGFIQVDEEELPF